MKHLVKKFQYYISKKALLETKPLGNLFFPDHTFKTFQHKFRFLYPVTKLTFLKEMVTS